MGFGTPITEKKPRKAEPLRRITGGPAQSAALGGLVRIVLLAVLATMAAAYGMYLYYTHAFAAKPRPAPAPSASSSSEIWIDLK